MYSQLVNFIFFSLFLLSLSRLILAIWQYKRVFAARKILTLFIGGLRIDLLLVAALSSPVVLISPWLHDLTLPNILSKSWLLISWLLICLLELSTPQFINEYNVRPNKIYFEYLKYPKEVFGMIYKGYALGTIAVLCGLLFFGLFAYNYLDKFNYLEGPENIFLKLNITILSAIVCFLCIRGTFRHRPINPSSVAYSNDPLLNSLALNSLYSVAYAVYSTKNERSATKAYGDLTPDEVVGIVCDVAKIDPIKKYNENIPTLHLQKLRNDICRTPYKHLVIIVEESLGAKYTGCLGGLDLSPNFDKLSKEGWFFSRAYATGTRSVRGLEALVSGFPPSISDAVLRLPNSQTNFFTLAHLFRQFGFKNRFIYGGEAHFDNMQGFFMGNGFDELHDRKSFTSPKFVGTWGVSDEDMFTKLHELLLSSRTSPTFTVAFTVSNHSPWEYPKGRIFPVGDPDSVNNTVRYADWALGDFFDKAKSSCYWDETLFLVVADHEARVGGHQLVPVQYFHIPALIIGGQQEVKIDNRIISQIDLPVTLLSLLGLNCEHPMIGYDMTKQDLGGRALMQYGDNFGYLKNDLLVVMQPGKDATQWLYSVPDIYTQIGIESKLCKEALAHALWPDYIYRTKGFTLPHLLGL